MKSNKILILLIIIISCNSPNHEIYRIDTRTFIENEISLVELADEIKYIPLDDSYPIGNIFSMKKADNSFYLSAMNVGILKYNSNGTLDRKIGTIGRGPGEYLYFFSFTVDEKNEKIYIKDRDGTIKVYSNEGNFIKSIVLPKCDDGFPLDGVEYFNNNLFISQYINMGHAQYNWIIMDTAGNVLSRKLNSIPAFKSGMGASGGTFKFKDNISYWNYYNDTIFSISSDLSSKAVYLFSPGVHRMPRSDIRDRDLYDCPLSIFETNHYLVMEYTHKNTPAVALIYKRNKESLVTFLSDFSSGGFINNLDGGSRFLPKYYFTEEDREYMVGLQYPHQIKTCVASDEFKNSTPKYPEKKKELEKLTASLKEADNPVLVLVRLKK